MSVGVFVSYNNVDRRIASDLSTCLVSLSGDFRVFIDHAEIGPGEDYEKKISESINDSIWFIMINPGNPSPEKDIGWCLYEAGQFRNRLTTKNISDKTILNAMCVIYDRSIPSQTNRYQATLVQDRTPNGDDLHLNEDSLSIELTPVFKLFATLLTQSVDKPLRDLSKPDDRKLVRNQARTFINAFLTKQVDQRLPEVPLQPRISLVLAAPPPEGLTLVDPTTEVTGWGGALSDIFGITGEKTTWGEIKTAFRLSSGADALWIQDLEEALISITANLVPTQSNMLCHGKKGALFQPVVARYFPFVSKCREVFILFVQAPMRSLIPREALSIAAAALPKQQVLLISLLFAFRFRAQVLPRAEAAMKIGKGESERLKSQLMRIEREIMVLENEAEEYGFDTSEDRADQSQLADFISDKDDQTTVVGVTGSWAILRGKLIVLLSDLRNPKTATSVADISDDVIRELVAMREPNKQFTEAILRELARSQDLDVQ